MSTALVTGARFGELARLRVSDYHAVNNSVFVAESKSGKPRHIALPPGGADLLNASSVTVLGANRCAANRCG
ncbi:hypothetical protein CK228_34155 [Mesorhizobium sp. WSM4312]|uniref:tyrosine-type recombinase/integrase n=1 Tax=Mesorhizobium sp. WSM4312 TaxID=2029411 RepID=UPI000BAFCA38|nr:tyrosine-type recombinase/integrase [Mesorhizobium sp. WSM4312]PBB64250.1 hypothetical protein CK228_34155 [Mesorhizobium sp. WSM4312]